MIHEPGDYIYLIWDSEPDWEAVRGHVDRDVAEASLRANDIDPDDYDAPVARFGHWGFPSEFCVEGADRELRIHAERGRGRFPITVFYPKSPPEEAAA